MITLLAAWLGLPGLSSAGEYRPDYARIRRGLATPATVVPALQPGRSAPVGRVTPGRRDSIWNGLLIGAAVGAGGGYLWARNECGDDSECAAITNPVGILVGGAIGAAVGGILDWLAR